MIVRATQSSSKSLGEPPAAQRHHEDHLSGPRRSQQVTSPPPRHRRRSWRAANSKIAFLRRPLCLLLIGVSVFVMVSWRYQEPSLLPDVGSPSLLLLATTNSSVIRLGQSHDEVRTVNNGEETWKQVATEAPAEIRTNIAAIRKRETGTREEGPATDEDDSEQEGDDYEDDGYDESGVEYHVVFSTGCTAYQDWQSYVFFYHAMAKQQPGTITRIASGCSPKDRATLQRLFDEQVAPMASDGRFRIHFTPDYSRLKHGSWYKYFNKPFGMKHWMENALGFPDNPTNGHAVVILMDPDQMIMRPFRDNNFTETRWFRTISGPWDSLDDKGKGAKVSPPRTRVEHGKPIAQIYGFGLEWRDRINMSLILPESESSPIYNMTRDEAHDGYTVGPPYIATARDMYAIVTKWTEFVVPVHDQYPQLLAEMFAYSLAAAHLKLYHQSALSFMLSSVTIVVREDWSYVDTLDDWELCQTNTSGRLPNVLHYCQGYGVGYWFFTKYRVPRNFLTCGHPLFREPPADFLTSELMRQVHWPGETDGRFLTPKIAKRNAFMTCHLLRGLNEAAAYFKRRHCPDSTGNVKKSFALSLPISTQQ